MKHPNFNDLCNNMERLDHYDQRCKHYSTEPFKMKGSNIVHVLIMLFIIFVIFILIK